MKWSGQHIYDLVSRFRDSVYLEDLSTTTETNVLVVDSNGKISKSTSLADDIIEAEIDTLAGLTSFGSAGATTNILAGDIDWYNPVTNGNPVFRMGVDADESLQIKTFYQTGTQSMQLAQFVTKTESATANDGRFIFYPDEVKVVSIDDGGIDFEANMGISINGTDILTDSSGTATLSNIDALDATTEATIENALDTLPNVTSLGTLTGLTLDGDRNVTPGDGGVIHVDAHVVTDTNTSASGTAAIYTHVNIEGPKLAATNASVTTTNAATLYIKDAPAAHTNQTLTNAYALWVDSGNVQFDGALTVGGTITGDVTGDLTGTASLATTVTITDNESTNENNALIFTAGGDVDGGNIGLESDGTCTYNPSTGKITATGFIGALTGQAATVATIAGLAPNTATTQATQPAIESIGTDGDTLSILSDTLYMANTSASSPTVSISNQADDATGPRIAFTNHRKDGGGTTQAGEDDDILGTMLFQGYDDQGTPAAQNYAKIYADIHDATSGEESGRLTLQVANHDGGLGSGLILTGGSANDEIDITVGLGADSVVTIPGDIDLAGKMVNRVSQIVNLKGYATLQDDVYDFANAYNTDDEAPFQLDESYGSGTIGSGTEVTQSKLFRAGGFHVPFACTVSALQTQITCNNAGNVSIALVEYRPSDLAADLSDYPRTVYETVVNASDDSNNKVDTVTIAAGDLDATAVPAGSHLMIMVKGDGTSVGGTLVVSVAVGLSW